MNSNEKFAVFYGIMLGDGCLSQYTTKDKRERFVISITGHYHDDKEFYGKIIKNLLKSLGRKSVSIKKRKNNGTLEINFPDKKLFYKFKKHGFPIGKKGVNLKIPQYFFDNNLIKQITQGFFATDGSIVLTKNPNKFYPRLEGHGISPELILQIKNYLINIGMTGGFYKCKRKIKNPRWKIIHQQYRFQFNGEKNLILFDKLIGFINPKHKEKLKNFLKYSKEYDKAINKIPTQKQRPIREKINLKWLHPNLNRGPRAHETRALPTELCSHIINQQF